MKRFTKRAVLASLCVAGVVSENTAMGYTLSLFHNNDGESALLPDEIGPNEGGIARFVGLINAERTAAIGNGHEVLTISSGDNILPGVAVDAGEFNGVNYDAQALEAIDYDAVIIGNHEFDKGPAFLADLINRANDQGVSNPFLSANLDFSGEADLQALVNNDTIKKSLLVDFGGGRTVGIVGATTENLGNISSPGGVLTNDVVSNVQAEIDDLINGGAKTIVFVSHLQGVNEDKNVIGQLTGIDVAIAGGGDELLFNVGDPLLPSDAGDPAFDTYPFTTKDKDGNDIPVVTTSGSYGYLGRLVLTVDDISGDVLVNQGDSLPIRNFEPDGITPDATVQSDIEAPVAQFQMDAEEVIATTPFFLDGRREMIRTMETNMGNLVVDALVAAALNSPEASVLDDRVIGMTNSGGIRNSVTVADGAVTTLDTLRLLPFGNSTVIVEDLSVQILKSLLVNSVSQLPDADGRFGNWNGMRFEYDARSNNILNVWHDDGTAIILNGRILDPDMQFDLITNGFTALDKDGYDFDGDGLVGDDETNPVPVVAVSGLAGADYREAFVQYITQDLGGVIDDPAYDGTKRRVLAVDGGVPEPATMILAGLGGLALLRRRR